MRLWGWISLGLCFAFLGCGKAAETQSQGLPTFEVPRLDSEREQFLLKFPLLNDAEEEAPPIDPRTGRAPFGALIHMADVGKGGYCSTAHIVPGRITANAHCIHENTKPSEYFVVFYNKRGVKRYERVLDFVYVGDQKNDDVAVLQLAPSVGRNWDTVSGKVVNSRREIGLSTPVLHKVVMWSFNPFEGNHPELFEKYKRPGMRFTPKHCNASRTIPRVDGIAMDEMGGELRRTKVAFGAPKEVMHWMVDSCDKRPVKGNSGSLITAADDITSIFGAYHWNIPADEGMRVYQKFEYRGAADELLELTWDDLENRDLFGVGTDFDFVLGAHPGLF